MENETISINKAQLDDCINSLICLQRKWKRVSKVMFDEARSLLPDREASKNSPVIEFGGLCYLSTATEIDQFCIKLCKLIPEQETGEQE